MIQPQGITRVFLQMAQQAGCSLVESQMRMVCRALAAIAFARVHVDAAELCSIEGKADLVVAGRVTNNGAWMLDPYVL